MFNVYQHTRAWPDGGSMLSQPAIVGNVFHVIETQYQRLKKRNDRDTEAFQ